MHYACSIVVLLVISFLLPSIAWAADTSASFKQWLLQVKPAALESGVSEPTYNAIMSSVHYVPAVVEKYQQATKQSVSFNEYKEPYLTPLLINKGKRAMKRYDTLLQKLHRQYGVQPRFIVAVWAVESRFGESMGSFYTPSALATLAYASDKKTYFLGELINTLLLVEQGELDKTMLLGSWVGALGHPQFMPTTYYKYAIDYDGDDLRDTASSIPDALASIANMLASEGWNDTISWGRKVMLPDNFNTALANEKKMLPLKEWSKLGLVGNNGQAIPYIDLQARVVLLGDRENQAYIAYANYNTLIHWNHSDYFATTVGLFSDYLVENSSDDTH